MAGVVQKVTVLLGAKSEGSVKAVFGRFQNLAGKSADAVRGIGRAIFSLPTAITGVVGGIIIKQLTSVASNAEEIGSKFDAVFKGLREPARAWAIDFAAAVNRSDTSVEKWLGTLQDTFVPLGFARDEAFSMSKAVTKLAVDLASFNNLPTDEVLRALQSGIVGNVENFRQFGVIVNQAVLNQELMNMGILGGVKAATEQQKAQARMQLLIKGTVDAQGDAIRTAGSWANQMRGLGSVFERFQITLGNFIIKNEGARNIITQVNDLIKALTEQFGTGATAGLLMTDVVNQISQAFSDTITSIQEWVEGGGVVDTLNRARQAATGFIPIIQTMAKGLVDAGAAILPLLDSVIKFTAEHPKLALTLLGLWATSGPLIAGISLFSSTLSLASTGMAALGATSVATGIVTTGALTSIGVALAVLQGVVLGFGVVLAGLTVGALLGELPIVRDIIKAIADRVSGLSGERERGEQLGIESRNALALRARRRASGAGEEEEAKQLALREDERVDALTDKFEAERLALQRTSRIQGLVPGITTPTAAPVDFDALTEAQQSKMILAGFGGAPITTPRVAPATAQTLATGAATVQTVNVNIENRIMAEITLGEEALATQLSNTVVPKILALVQNLESRVQLAIADALRDGSEQQRSLAGG